MNPIDDMFRDGLGGRKGELPDGLWDRISQGRQPVRPEGEGVDQYFASALKDHQAPVPPDMWSRISASGVPAPATLDRTFAEGLGQLQGTVPAGLWDRIWAARAGQSAAPFRRWAAAAAVLLLVGFATWWLASPAPGAVAVSPDHPVLASAPSVATPAAPVANDAAVAGRTAIVLGDAAQDAKQPGEGANIVAPTPTVATAASPSSPTEDGIVAPTPTVVVDPEALAPIAEPTAGATPPTGRNLPAASPSLSVAPLALAALPIADPELTVKKQHLPRRDQLSTYVFKAAPRHLFKMELLFGAMYADQQFQPLTPDQNLLRDIRSLNENANLSYQVTLRGSYNLSRRFHLLGGLTYAEIRNELGYTQVTNGQSRDIRTNNQLRILEAPLLLGLRLPGRRMEVSLNAGPVVNLAFGARGRFISPDAPRPLSLKEAGNYRSHLGVGLMSSLSINYKIGKKEPFLLLVEPFFKAYPTAFTVADAPLKESYWAAGVQFGVRKGF